MRIAQPYGRTLTEMEQNISAIIRESFTDADGFILCSVNKRTLRPFADDDPEVNLKPVSQSWIARGGFPDDLKKTYMNYEDSDMAAGDCLMARLSKFRKTGDAATQAELTQLFRAMVRLYDTVAAKNPLGVGFLPKPYGGIERAVDSYEMSADQYLKFTVALEKYALLTTDENAKRKTTEIFLAFAKWLDDRDFVTPYMGFCNYGRLQFRMHYLAYFAYIMALGYRLSGNEHYRQEALFFREKMLTEGRVSVAPNSLNLVVENCDRLIELMPEYKADWLGIMLRDWDHRTAFMEDDSIAHFSGYRWNFGPRQASTYNTIVRHFPERAGDLDLGALLLKHNALANYVHEVSADNPDDMTYPEHAAAVIAQSYASWLRAYWESPLAEGCATNQ